MRTLASLCTLLLLLLIVVTGVEAQGRAIIDEIVVWPVVMADGHTRTNAQFDPSAVSFNGDCAAVGAASTRELFDMIALDVIKQGLAEGTITCSSNCTGSGATVRVITAACVERTGNGCSTHFTACNGTSLAWRDYQVCCSNGTGGPTITLIGFDSPGCAGTNCESTVPAIGGGVLK